MAVAVGGGALADTSIDRVAAEGSRRDDELHTGRICID